VISAPLVVTHGPSSYELEPRYKERFGACRRLREAAWASRPVGVVAGPDFNEAEPAQWMIFFRSIQTFDAAIFLCDRGYGPQALMLGRSLFEDMAVAYRTRREPTRARESFIEHLEHSREVYRDSLRELGLPIPPELDATPALDPDRRAELDKKFGRHGHKLWTEDHVRKIVDEIEETVLRRRGARFAPSTPTTF
jgi:hypothetical protein